MIIDYDKLNISLEKELQNELIFIIRDLILSYDEKGLRASGKFADSLKGELINLPNKYELLITGEEYAGAMEHGRSPSTGGDGSLKAIIRQWIDDKKIIPKKGISKDSLAFLITRKIHQEGITVPNQFNKGKVIEDVLIGNGKFENPLERIRSKFNDIYVSNIYSDIVKNLKI